MFNGLNQFNAEFYIFMTNVILKSIIQILSDGRTIKMCKIIYLIYYYIIGY